MSKFIEKLKNRTQISPAPMGFGRASVPEKTRILLIAAVSQVDLKNAGNLVKGADAGLLLADGLDSLRESLSEPAAPVSDIIWGAWLRQPRLDKTLKPEIKADFLVFPPEMPLLDLPPDLGRVLAIGDGFTDAQLRAVEDLPVAAVLFTVNPGILDWQYLVNVQRLDNMITKPLLAVVPAGITAKELQALWSVGVDGAVIEVDAAAANRLKELHREIEKAVFPLPRKSKKLDVLLPLISQEKPVEAEEEPEEDE